MLYNNSNVLQAIVQTMQFLDNIYREEAEQRFINGADINDAS